MSKEGFEPKWSDEPNDDGVYVPEDLDSRTPHPSTPPKAVLNFVSSTYHPPSQKPKNEFAKFTLFPNLAIELRRIIWRLSLPGQRVVELLYDNCTGQCRSSCPIPTTLHVNSESRGLALEHYTLAFGTERAEASIYFDFKIDALFLGVGNFSPPIAEPVRYFLRSLQQKDLESIENIIVEDYLCPFYRLCELNTASDIDDESNDGIDNSEPEAETSSVNSEFSWGDELLPFEPLFRGMSSLQTLTIVTNGTSADMVFQEAEHNLGEFRLWLIVEESGRLLPMCLRDQMECSLFQGSDIPELWRGLELAKWAGDMSAGIVRIVARARLESEETWQKRAHFLEQVVIPGGYNYCLYPRDGVIDRVLEMEQGPWNELHDYLGIDPEYLYVSHARCVCPVGHRHQPLNVDEPDLLKHHNLQEGLSAFLARREGFEEEKFEEDDAPGAFQEEPEVNNEDVEPSLQISAWDAIAMSTSLQSLDPDLTASAISDLPPPQNGSDLMLKHELEQQSTLADTSLSHQIVVLLARYFPSRFLGILTAINEIVGLGGLLYGMLFLDVKDLWGPTLGFGICLFVNRLRSLTRSSSDDSPDLLALLFRLFRRACLLVVEEAKKHIIYISAATMSRYDAPLGQNTLSGNISSGNTITVFRRRAYDASLVCLTISIWILLVLIGLALAFSLMKLLVGFMSVLMLFVAGLWLLGAWLRVLKAQNK